MKKLTPIKVSVEDTNLNSQLGVQVIERTAPLSRDPENYPVFKTPVNKKVLIYVPNHIVQDKEGKDILRMDTPFIHIVQNKNRFEYYRCISGLHSEAHGYDGTCPLCDGASDPWTLANLVIQDKCKARGLNPEDTDNDDVKAIKSAAYSARVLGDAERYYTFPIVVFDTVNDDAKTFVTDEATGNISYKIMWYSISERGWEKKWAKALENMEDEPTHPGGLFLTLDYTYTPKRGEPNARDSARELQVYSKKIKNSEKLREVLDKQTESWTPEVARDMVIRNNLYAYADLEAVTEECLENTRNLIALYEAKGEAEVEGIEAASEFNLEKKTTPASETAVAMDDTDEDFDAEGLEVQ